MDSYSKRRWLKILLIPIVFLCLASVLWLPPSITRIEIDNSAFGKHFVSQTEIPFISIRTFHRSRHRTVCVAFIGSNHSLEWLEELGFVSLQSLRAKNGIVDEPIRSIPAANFFLDEDDVKTTEPVYILRHPMSKSAYFYYLPRTGMLSYDAEDVDDYK